MTATVETLELGSRVRLAELPQWSLGEVVRIMSGRYFVKWQNGQIWIYAATQLELVD